MKNGAMIFWGAIVILVVLALGATFLVKPGPSNLEPFAACLKESGATFYGAFWCPHCQNQKRMFGSAAESLPYVECSTPDGQGQIQACTDKGVQSYPTWEFADGSRLTGEQSLLALSQKTGCQIPSVEVADDNGDTGDN